MYYLKSMTLGLAPSLQKAGLYRLIECIWVLWIEGFVGPHQGHEVFGLAKVDYIMCVSWQHMYCLDGCLTLCTVHTFNCLAFNGV